MNLHIFEYLGGHFKFQGRWPSLSIALVAAAILIFAVSPCPAHAANRGTNQATGSGVEVTTVVTVMGANDKSAPPAVAKGDVNVTMGKSHLTVADWQPLQNSGKGNLQLAILIDNALRTTIIGGQLEELGSFINSLPPSTAVGIFYGENGAAEPSSGGTSGSAVFSTDHAAVIQDLRVSMGRTGGDSPSIYLSLGDLVKRWQPGAGRREVLMLTSGVDALNPGTQDPYFDSTLQKVQSAGVIVHTIYDGTDRFGSTFRGDLSQGKLVEITTNSGGQGYFEGNGAPVSIAPFLNELNGILADQYLLTFSTEPSKHAKGELRGIEIHLEERDLKVSYPKQVLVPGK